MSEAHLPLKYHDHMKELSKASRISQTNLRARSCTAPLRISYGPDASVVPHIHSTQAQPLSPPVPSNENKLSCYLKNRRGPRGTKPRTTSNTFKENVR